MGEEFKSGPASEVSISLSQALLAPLDAILKAQLHSARSFLNLLLQLGYRHKQLDNEGMPVKEQDIKNDGKDVPYYLEFAHEVADDGKIRKQKVKVPALALIPVAPLSVESADFSFDMAVRNLEPHKQIQSSEEAEVNKENWGRTRRPWYLVDQPVSICGVIAPPSQAEGQREANIHVSIKITRGRMPEGVDKLLTTLTQVSRITEEEEEQK